MDQNNGRVPNDEVPVRLQGQLDNKALNLRVDELRPFYIPNGGVQSEEQLFNTADELMADIEREKRAREWLLAELLWSWIDNIPQEERERTTKYKNEDYIVKHYCREFSDRYGGSYITYYHRMRGFAIKRDRDYDCLDTNAISASMVYRVESMANGDREVEEETLRRLDEGDIRAKDVEETTYLQNQGHQTARPGKYEFYVIPETSEIYWRIDDSPLNPCTFPSEGWTLLVKRLGAKPLDKVTAGNGGLGEMVPA